MNNIENPEMNPQENDPTAFTFEISTALVGCYIQHFPRLLEVLDRLVCADGDYYTDAPECRDSVVELRMSMREAKRELNAAQVAIAKAEPTG